jgi:hypothetical protein
MRRIALAVPPLERETQRLAHVGTELDALEQHVADFAARRKVVRRPLARVLLNELHDLLAFFGVADTTDDSANVVSIKLTG